MAIPSAADSVLSDMNSLLALIIAERDRLSTLTKKTLPGGVSIWNVVSSDVRVSVINDATANLASAQNFLDNITVGIGAI